MDKSEVKIFSGSASRDLAENVARNLKMGLGKIDIARFSDGEFQPVFQENIRGRIVFLIQSGYAPIDNYWELFQMIDAAKKASASRIIAVVPYFGYGRQDRKDKPRCGIGAKLVANFLETAGATRVVTIDLHADQIGGFFDIPVDQLHASYMFVPYLKGLGLPNPVVAAPDTGGTKKAKYLSENLGCEMVLCYKHRSKANEIDEMILIGDVKGKDVIIVDDIIDTAGTLCKSADLMLSRGAASVRAVITHPVMSGDAYKNVQKSGLTELVVSDTIPLKEKIDKITVISSSALLSRAIRNIVDHKSLSKLFVNKKS